VSAKSSNPKKKGGRNRRAHAKEVKAAVLAALLAGQDIETVAKHYKLPIGTVKGWKSKQRGEQPISTTPAQKADVGELLLDYLREGLATLKLQQTTLFRNDAWLMKQGASEMAVLHGVIADKCVRLLEAMSGEGPAESLT